ncbi:heme-degrading domain-containing protein [Tropicimonas isoalkanivorans]|uniref:Uncharacterized protein, UPF0303 family n=1 Tax=Tropicimonas isoalkanivorans TaxID=441112 RepID=A0A1I1DST1_9RHOB|nr:heme-degrading domain-containing protein [Tropicimonas isoalkanivorans]SFB78069.1 Uncharacterized protein, UPF0303 family [Tropicimonas isoalkanivorans]
MTQPTIDDLEQQEARFVFAQFNEETAYEVGTALVESARSASAPVIVDIRTPDRTLFHAAMPGSAPDNDHWARRKSNTVLRQHRSSLLAGMRLAAKGRDVGPGIGLDPMEFSAHGGSVPIRVSGVGVIGAITVSGLASEEDHAMIAEVLSRHLGLAD